MPRPATTNDSSDAAFDALLDQMPGEFSIGRLREVGKLHGVTLPRRVTDMLLERNYRKCKVGFRKPEVPNQRWDHPTTIQARSGAVDSRN